jgi:hypothetical protein
MGFIGSPFLSPFVFGFLVARTRCVENSGVPVIELIPHVPKLEMGIRDWIPLWPCGRCAYRLIYGRDVGNHTFCFPLFLKIQSIRMYDRALKPVPPRPSTGIRYRIESLIGITGAKMANHRSSWYQIILSPLNLIWRPHLLAAVVFQVLRSLYMYHF